MRILYISGENVPGEVGGSIHVWEVASNLAKLGHELFVLCNKSSGQQSFENIDGVNVIRNNVVFFNNTIPIIHLIRFFSIPKCDVIIERYSVTGGLGMVLSKLHKTSLIIEVNGPHLYEAKHLGKIKGRVIYKIAELWSNLQFSAAKYIMAPIDTIIPLKYRNKFYQVEWGVNEKLFNKDKKTSHLAKLLKKELGLERFEKIFLFHGSFRAWHGVELILEVAKKLKFQGYGTSVGFVLVGGGDLWNKVHSEININKLDNVVLISQIKYFDLPKYLAVADVGIAPFNMEKYTPLKKFGFYWSPLKIFEYMSMSLPVITINILRLTKLLSKNNYFFNHNDVDDLENQLINIIKTPKNKLVEVGEENRKLVLEKYTWFSHAKQINNLIKDKYG